MRKVILLAAFVCLTGCSSVDYEQLGSGYITKTFTHTSISEPQGHRFELKYSPGKSKWWKTVWPDVFGIAVTNGIAVFEAHTAAGAREHWYAPWPMRSRLFAVKAPEMPLDITDEVLWRCASQPGPQLYASLRSPFADGSWPSGLKPSDTNLLELIHKPNWGIFLLQETNSVLKFCGPDYTFYLDWNLVPDIMREVKEKGVITKDPALNTEYIEKAFPPESRRTP